MLCDNLGKVGCVEVSVKNCIDVPIAESPFKDFTSNDLALYFLKKARNLDGSYDTEGVENSARVLCNGTVKVVKKVWEDSSFSWEITVQTEDEKYEKFHQKVSVLPEK